MAKVDDRPAVRTAVGGAALVALTRYRWVALAVAFAGSWAISMVTALPAPLAPLFQPELGLSKAQVGLFSAAISAGQCSVIIFTGFIADRFGIRRIVALGLSLTGLLLMSMPLAGSFLQATLVVIMAGVAKAGATPGITRAVFDWFPVTSRGIAMGIKQLGMPVAGLIAATTMPALGLALGWRNAFAIGGLMILGVGILFGTLYREAPGARTSTSVPSIRDAARALARNRPLWVLNGAGVMVMATQITSMAYLALYFKDVILVPSMPDDAARIVVAGLYLAVSQVGGIFGRIAWGVASDRIFHSRRGIVLTIIEALASLTALIVSQLGPGSPTWLLVPVVFALGTTAVGWNGVFNALVTEMAGRKYAGTGVGLNMAISEIGAMAGPPLFGLIVDASGTYRLGWLFVTAVAAAGSLASFAVSRTEKPTRLPS